MTLVQWGIDEGWVQSMSALFPGILHSPAFCSYLLPVQQSSASSTHTPHPPPPALCWPKAPLSAKLQQQQGSSASASEPGTAQALWQHAAGAVTHHGGSSVANQGWLGGQLVLLHDARGGDSQRSQVQRDHHCTVRKQQKHLETCRHRQKVE